LRGRRLDALVGLLDLPFELCEVFRYGHVILLYVIVDVLALYIGPDQNLEARTGHINPTPVDWAVL
jgi:hypothetical protein